MFNRPCRSRSGWFSTVSASVKAEPEQNPLERAKPGKRGLEQVQSDKGRQYKPERVYPITQRQAGQNERSGNEINNSLDFHRLRGQTPYLASLSLLPWDCESQGIFCAEFPKSLRDKHPHGSLITSDFRNIEQ